MDDLFPHIPPEARNVLDILNANYKSTKRTERFQKWAFILTGSAIVVTCFFQVKSTLIAEKEYELHLLQNIESIQKAKKAEGIEMSLRNRLEMLQSKIDSLILKK